MSPERDRSLIRDISDTALWAAIHRANESERKDAFFRDPFARRLAGEGGERIGRTMPSLNQNAWSWAIRTVVFDELIIARVQQGVDLVVNLAAGLDARPYRLALPSRLRWVEVDLPGLIAYKEEILRGEKPSCVLERVALDLSDAPARRSLFSRLGAEATSALVVTEGLLIYLPDDGVASLAHDLAAPVSFRHWVIDLVSPGLLRILRKHIGSTLSEAGAPLVFGPEEGPEFFARYGWRPVEVHSMLKTAARKKRLPFLLRAFALLPESKRPGSRPWGGVCRLEKHTP